MRLLLPFWSPNLSTTAWKSAFWKRSCIKNAGSFSRGSVGFRILGNTIFQGSKKKLGEARKTILQAKKTKTCCSASLLVMQKVWCPIIHSKPQTNKYIVLSNDDFHSSDFSWTLHRKSPSLGAFSRGQKPHLSWLLGHRNYFCWSLLFCCSAPVFQSQRQRFTSLFGSLVPVAK